MTDLEKITKMLLDQGKRNMMILTLSNMKMKFFYHIM